MISLREKTDLLKLFSENQLDGFAHQTNQERRMGRGFALKVANQFPEALEALKKSQGFLGEVSMVKTDHGTIWNATAQSLQGIGRRTNYEAFFRCFELIENQASQLKPDFRLAVPYNIGCGYGGGSWNIVSAILFDLFDKSTVRLIICKID
jgi:hypothetical protein